MFFLIYLQFEVLNVIPRQVAAESGTVENAKLIPLSRQEDGEEEGGRLIRQNDERSQFSCQVYN